MLRVVWLVGLSVVVTVAQDTCTDANPLCPPWAQAGLCVPNTYVYLHCLKSCNRCKTQSFPEKQRPRAVPANIIFQQQKGTPGIHKDYDPARLPEALREMEWLLGVWREEFRGKARFPTMPTFTYGEEISFSISDHVGNKWPALNYTAFAWGLNTQMELHSESGFLTGSGFHGALSTVMNNGFNSIEEGSIQGHNNLVLDSRKVHRSSFSRDLPVTVMRRIFTLVGPRTLQQSFAMGTITHPMEEHARITYKKIYP